MQRSKPFLTTTFLSVLLIVTLDVPGYTQKHKRWVIENVVTTFLQIGVAEPVETNYAEQRKICLGKCIYQKGSVLHFDKSLKKSQYYQNALLIGPQNTMRVAKDDELTMRYPGDELLGIAPNCKNCFVGKSFMKLIHSNQKILIYNTLKGKPTETYFLCKINGGKKLALYMANDFVILILRRM